MKSLLGALQGGRLVELPSTDKETSLRYLAHLIEAVPDMGSGIDLAEEILKRERSGNSGIGLGVACPHVRVPGNGELLCSAGWSPAGMDYGSSDGRKVHLVVMYLIPDIQKNAYLKEVSALVQAVKREGDIQSIARAEDIPSVRERLLDWVSGALDAGIPQVRAKMIRLEARQALATGAEAPGPPIQVHPLLIVCPSENQRIALCENREVSILIEKDSSIAAFLRQRASFERGGFRFVYRSTVAYDPARPLHEYIAVRTS